MKPAALIIPACRCSEKEGAHDHEKADRWNREQMQRNTEAHRNDSAVDFAADSWKVIPPVKKKQEQLFQ